MEYPYFKGLEADRYSFYRVPKALVKADLFQKMSGDEIGRASCRERV